jgi:hypothetical protein
MALAARTTWAAAVTLTLLATAACAGPPTATTASGTVAPTTPSALTVSVESPAPVASLATAPTRRVAPRPPTANAVVTPVGAAQWARIVAVGMARRGCPMTRASLRRVEVGYWGFDGRVHRGVLVVNADVARSTARILTRLFDARFPIRRMRPIEEYAGDDNASMAADNTSAFNCRSTGQANAPSAASPHANGRAIDINPYENPWRDPRCRCWSPSARYGTTRAGRGVIVKGGVVWTAFTREGWIWQDIATADYMHFDTGYPSRPLRGSR